MSGIRHFSVWETFSVIVGHFAIGETAGVARPGIAPGLLNA
jgi:hypothetical protein